VAGLGLLSGCGIPFGPAAQPARPHRIGYLGSGSPAQSASNLEAFRHGLRELGYVEGQNVVFERRYAEGREARYPELAAELVRLEVDVMLAGGSATIRALGQATATIPIVFPGAGPDPVADGLVASLARPGGNITGLSTYAGEENAKRLELLTEAVPGLSRVAVLWNQTGAAFFREAKAAGEILGVQILSLELQSPDQIDTVLAGAIRGGADGLVVTSGPVFSFLALRIVEFAVQRRLPAMYAQSDFTRAGGLLMYGVSLLENHGGAASYVDKILKGTKPADLPVQQPTIFDFVINLKAAQAIGLTIPQSVLQQATEIIQ
jgi:putative tryptophan/tyrosine transport system substrate-binding protein